MALISRSLNPNRSLSLDVFRGLTLAFMILVNHPGGPQSYAQLEHVDWNGWTLTDLVFPSFAFIIGVALTYSLSNRGAVTKWKGWTLFDWIAPILVGIKLVVKIAVQTNYFRQSANPTLGGYDLFLLLLLCLLILIPRLERRATTNGGGLTLQIIHRGLLLFAVGFIWDLDPTNPTGFRVFGILQRLGLSYIFASLIVVQTRRRGQIAAVVGLLAVYWILMKSVPVPGFGSGVLTVAGNLGGYIDKLILGSKHLYQQSPVPWDPEGILGIIPTVATLLLGALAGGWMREEQPSGKKLSAFIVGGSLLLAAAYSLAPWFPINKNLWSPPFVLLAAGIDILLLGACFWLVDVKRITRIFYPFIVLGSNSILIYLLSGTFMHYLAGMHGATLDGERINAKEAAYHFLFASWLSPYNASLAFAVAYVAIWTAIAGLLYRRRIFVKI